MTENKSRKRKKVVYTCPNPLFEQWLKGWRDEAVEKGWKTQYIYSKALKSLQKYPLPLSSGQEAKILENFGDKICAMLDEKLAQHHLNTRAADSQVEGASTSANTNPSKNNRISKDAEPKKNPLGECKEPKEFVPIPRSGAHALLTTLYNAEENNLLTFMKKADLLVEAQQYCDVSFTVPKPNSHYTAWSSMSTLIRKNLVIKVGNPARYSLTEGGRNLARKLEISTDNDAESVEGRNSQPSSYPEFTLRRAFGNEAEAGVEDVAVVEEDTGDQEEEDLFTLHPGAFDVILCVDNCETTPGIATNRKSSLLPELRKNGIVHDVRKLHVGDFLWIARERVLPCAGQLQLPQAKELVLDYVVERKRMDDLAHSIKDGRFHEQKFRLKSSGLRCPMYLVEDFGTGNLGLPDASLQQAIVNTQIVDGFIVKQTKDQKESVAFLTLMTRYLQSIYCNQTLTSCSVDTMASRNCGANAFVTFEEFNFTAVKNKKLHVKEMFLKQLLQVHGLSLEKAAALTDLYATPLRLIEAYKSCSTTSEKEKLVSSVKFGKNQRNIGPTLSKIIYHFYCTNFS